MTREAIYGMPLVTFIEYNLSAVPAERTHVCWVSSLDLPLLRHKRLIEKPDSEGGSVFEGMMKIQVGAGRCS